MKKNLFAIVAVAGLSAAASAQVVNGGFESGLSNWNVTLAASGTYFGHSISFSHSGSGSVFFAAVDGLPDAIDQDVPTTPGEGYTVSFWLYNFTSGGDNMRVLWDGTEMFSIGGPAFEWTQFSFNAVGGAGATTNLRFEGFDGPDVIYLDDVAVTVPTPGAAAILGLGGLATLRRRRK